jgi:stalled ribosome rescue protein Dom34
MKQMAVWMDHHEARIFHVDGQSFDEKTLASATRHIHRHEKAGEVKVRNHPEDDHRFFVAIAHELAQAEKVLVLGPSVTKVQFVNYVKEHDAGLSAKIVAVENADHPTDRQIVAHVREHFHVAAPRLGGHDSKA